MKPLDAAPLTHRRFSWTLAAACLVLGLITLSGPRAQAYPRPELTSQAWQLDFDYELPELIAHEDLRGQTRWYWYMTYTVTNNSGRAQMFIPEVTIATDDGKMFSAGTKVPAGVFRRVKQREENNLLESSVEVIGRLLEGEDNAKDSVAIWPATDPEIDQLTMFVAGLSGETQIVIDSVTGEPMVDPETEKPVIVRKTLMLEYALPGNPPQVKDQIIELKNEEWIMR